MVFLGNENWNLVLNMMIGIQMAVKSVNTMEKYEVMKKDYGIKQYFELLPRRIN